MGPLRRSTRCALVLWSCVAFVCALCTLAVGIDSFAQTGETARYHVFTLKWKSALDIKKMLEDLLDDVDGETQIIADPKRNQILIRGSAQTREIARQLIRNTDRMPKVTHDLEKPLVETYRCPKEQLKSTADKLRSLFSVDSGVRIAVDSGNSSLLVLASPRLQKMIAGQLAALNNSKIQTVSPSREASPEENQQQFVLLENSNVESVRRTLRRLLRKRLKEQDGQHRSEFVVEVANQRVTLTGDTKQKRFTIVGPTSLTQQLTRLIERLDSPPQADGRKVRIVPIQNVDPDAIKRIVEAYRGSIRNETSRESPPSNSASPDIRPPEMLTPDDRRGSQPKSNRRQSSVASSATFEPVSFQSSQPADGVQAAPSPVQNGVTQPSEEDERLRDRIERLGNDVEIESLPDLDIIILRGRTQAVEEITRIIREIERLSAETAPAIEIYYLKHVQDEAVAKLVDQVTEDLTGGLQGRVSITPLARPNALLLIGWGEAVKAVKQLIEALDQPARPETLVRVFQLKHATANSARTTIEQFFDNRPGLGPIVKMSADNRTNALIVEASPRDMVEVKTLIDRLDVPKGRAVNRARIFKLKNSLAADLASILQATIDSARGGNAGKSAILEMLTMDPKGKRIVESGLLADVRITPDPRTNSVIVSAPVESMELLAALIKSLDESPASVAQIKVFRIFNSDARSLVQVLRSLMPSQTGASSVPRLASAKGETSLVPVRFAVETRTNSIIATGSPGDLKIIEALLLRLDEKGGQNRKSAVHRLKNVPALDVALAINEFLRTERRVQETVTGTENPFRQIESEVVVVPEPISNSLIISATPRFFDEIEALIEKLDAEPLQVMIQVIIAEVVLSETDEFGVELGLQDSLLFDRSLLGDLLTTTMTGQQSTAAGIVTSTQEIIQAATNTPGFMFNNQPLGNSGSTQSLATAGSLAGQVLSSFATGRINSELGYGGLVLSAGSENISVLIRALKDSRKIEILSRPQIMTLDNQPAFIQVGQRVPRIIGSTVNQSGQVNNIALENIGLILGVTPRISPDGMVVMEIDAEKSGLGPEADGIPVSVSASGEVVRSPRVNITTAQTTVSAADGETIVLAGLITKSHSETNRRVPFLSEIPVVKSLFKFDSDSTRRTELLIILTPHILKSPEDRQRMKQVEMARMHWVASDVYELHGASGACAFGDCPIDESMIPVIFPDMNPRGLLPEETGRFEGQLSRTGSEVDLSSLEETPLPIPIPDSRFLDQQQRPVDALSEQRLEIKDQSRNNKIGDRLRKFFRR